jgi:hypothetical protein
VRPTPRPSPPYHTLPDPHRCQESQILDQMTGVSTLGVQCVGGYHDTGHVQISVHGGQQRLETGDLVGLSIYFPLSHHDSAVMGHSGQQMHTTLPGLITGATQRLSVHRDRPNAGVLASQPGTDRTIQSVTIDRSQHATQGGLIGCTIDAASSVHACSHSGQQVLRQVSSPLADRGERACPGQRGSCGDQQDRGDRVASPRRWRGSGIAARCPRRSATLSTATAGRSGTSGTWPSWTGQQEPGMMQSQARLSHMIIRIRHPDDHRRPCLPLTRGLIHKHSENPGI